MTIPDPTEAAFYADTEHCGWWPFNSVRTVTIRPGETIWRTIDSADHKARARSFLTELGCFTEVLRRGYYHGSAEEVGSYEIGVPVLEVASVAALTDHRRRPVSIVVFAIRLDPPPPEGLAGVGRRPIYLPIHVDSTETPGQHILLMSRKDQPRDFRIDTPPGAILNLCQGSWVRLLTLNSKFLSVNATADRGGRIRIEYASEQGGAQALILDANRVPMLSHKN